MSTIRPKGGHLGLILPLCTSSATLGIAVFSYPIFLSLQKSNPSFTDKVRSHLWDHFVKVAGSTLVTTGVTSVISGLVCARWLQTHTTLETTAVSRWYMYGASFAAARAVMLTLATKPITRLFIANKEESTSTEGEPGQTAESELKEWLLYHTVQTVLIDVPALVCFAEGAAQSFWIV